MAGKIKGIMLEIGGDTTPLTKALKSANVEAKKTQDELENINRLLKLDPKNTDLLKQKQENLNKQLDITKNNLETLKTAKKKLDEDMKNGTEVNAEEYRRLQRNIAQTEADIKRLTEETKKFTVAGEKIKSWGNDISEFGNKMSDAGKKGAIASAAITAAGFMAVEAASDLEESTNKVDVAFGDSSEKIKKWAETTLDSYGIAKGTALDMAALYGDMGTAMGIPRNAAADMSASIVGLAGDLASFKNISLDTAQNALKGIFTGETESLKNLGVIMNETTLGEYALASGAGKTYKEMSQAEKVQLRYNYVMEQSANAQGDFARTSDGYANSSRVMTESIKEMSASFGEVLLPIITPIIQMFTNLIKWIASLSPVAKAVVVTVAAFIAIIPPLLILVGSLITSIGTITTAMGALNLTFLASPITWIIAGIVALVATFVILWNKCDAFRNFWIACWEGIRNGTKAIIDALKTFFTQTIPNIFSTVINFIKNNWQQILLFITNPIAGAIAFLYKLNPKFREWVDNLVASIKEKFAKMKEIGKFVMEGLWNGISDKIKWLKEKVKGVVDKIKSWFTGKEGFDEHSPSKWAEKVGEFLMQGLSNGITEDMSAEAALEKKISNIKDFITQNIDSIQNDIKQKQDKFAESLAGGSLYNTNTVSMGEESFTYFTLHDFTKDTQRNIDFGNSLSELENRLYSVSKNSDMNISFMQMVRDMGMDNAMMFIKAALSANDSEFANYVFGWQEYTKSAEAVAAQTYKNEAEQLKDGFLDTVTENLSETVDNFFAGGENSAQAFGQGFMQKIETIMGEITARLESYNSVFNLGSVTGVGRSSTTNNSTTNYNMSITNNGSTPSAYEQRTQFKRMLNTLALEARA